MSVRPFPLYTIMSITPLDKQFDVPRIYQDITDRIFADSAFDFARFGKINQFSLRDGIDWFDGTGSLYDYSTGEYKAKTSDYVTTSGRLVGTYLASAISEIEKFALETDQVRIGRIRIMRLAPKTCYTLHTDREEFRYHIPLVTDEKCFFLIDNQVYRMPNVGQLYKFRTNAEHTAVNASFQSRTHLVFDTFTP